jgi:ribulose-5-phosphate 4-epimerase/fuculose-1-phosphate aldolase
MNIEKKTIERFKINMINDRKITEMIDFCHQLYRKNLVSSTGGNVSIKVDNNILITATGICLGDVTTQYLVKTDLEGNVIGKGIPSKESDLHLKMYKNFQNCQIVAHIHSPYIIAVSLMINDSTSEMPIFTPGCAIRVGFIPFIPYYRPGSKELSNAVIQRINDSCAVILQNHGLVCWGETIKELINIVDEIEENVKILILTNNKGRSLSNKEVNELRRCYSKK